MLKKPGTFSNKYMSNPLPNQPLFHKQRNKQNRQPNTNQSEEQSYENPALCQSHNNNPQYSQLAQNTKPFQRSPSPIPKSNKTQNKLKMQWQKNEKYQQMMQEIKRLKRDNGRLRDDLKRISKTNQENICGYETYIKDIEADRDQNQRKCKYYGEQLKYCLIWMIQAFSLARDTNQHHTLINQKLSKNKMSQVIKKLSPVIEQLEIHKNLQQISRKNNDEQYLIQQKSTRFSHPQPTHLQPSFQAQEFNELLDTFDIHRQSQIPTETTNNLFDNIARRLFVNEDTFGQQIGQHEISEQYNESSSPHQHIHCSNSNSNKNQQTMNKKHENGSTVTITVDLVVQSSDYLKLKKGQKIKLLRKVGDLWIAENGVSIGYVPEHCFC